LRFGKNSTVLAKDIANQMLVLGGAAGKQVVFALPSVTTAAKKRIAHEVYEKQERKLIEGDIIRWTKTDKTLGTYSPDFAKIEKIEQGLITAQPLKVTEKGYAPEGSALHFKAQDQRYRHWDHAYAITGLGSQAKTVKGVSMTMESQSKYLTNQIAFLVGVTRAVYDVEIVTDDKAALLNKINSSPGFKASALETIEEFGVSKSKSLLSGSIEEGRVSTPGKAQKTSTAGLTQFDKGVTHQRQSHLSSVSAASQKTEPYHAKARLDAREITQALSDNTEYVLERLLGSPKSKDARYYRYGTNKGSMVVSLQGDKRGLWNDFQTGEGGNLLHLIAKERNIDLKQDFRKGLEAGLEVLGRSELSFDRPLTQRILPAKEPTKVQKSYTLEYAKRIAQQSQPIKGTLAEKYLKEHRGIELEHWPESLRYHPGIRSGKDNKKAVLAGLFAVAKDAKGEIQAGQATYLDKVTAQKAKVNLVKQTFGLPSRGAAVLLESQETRQDVVYLAEGIETGLSIYQAMPKAKVQVTLSLSNFNNAPITAKEKIVVLCTDNDGPITYDEKGKPCYGPVIDKVSAKLHAEGKEVWIARPNEVKDYNDLLKSKGVKAIRENILAAALYSPDGPSKPGPRLEASLKEQLKKQEELNLNHVSRQHLQIEQNLKSIKPHSNVNEKALGSLSRDLVPKESQLTQKIKGYFKEEVTGKNHTKNSDSERHHTVHREKNTSDHQPITKKSQIQKDREIDF